MKKVTCLLAALLLACGLSWAQTTDVLNHDVIGVNGTTYSTWTGITSNSDAVYAGNTAGGNNAIQMRSNNSNSGIVTTASGGVVTNITVVWNENTSSGRTLNVYGKNAAYSAATDLYGNNAGTLIGTIVEGTSTEIDIDDEYAFIGIRSASGALYLDEVSITWGEGSGVTPPSITASNVEIAYDATSGVIEYSISNPVDGGELTAATEAEWLTIGTVGETVPFTCTVNEDGAAREAVVTLTYTYGEQTISQTVTVTQAGNPNTLDNISDITATGAYAVQGTIVAKSQRGFIVGDGTGYVYYYNQNYVQDDYNIGDMVKLAGNVVIYGGVFEFNNTTTVTPANSSNYVAEDPTVITGEEMDARVASTTPAQLSSYVQYEGTLSINNNHYNITNIAGAITAIGSISYPLDTEFASLNGQQVKVSGYYVGISSSTYYNTMIGSVEEIASTEPIITLSPASVDVEATEAEGALTMTYLNMGDEPLFEVAYFEADGQTEATYDWIIAEVEGDQVNYIIGANQGEARTAYLKVYGTDGNIDVYSNLVTINQEAYVAPALDYATLPFEFNGGKADIEGTDGLTAEGLGNDYNSAPKLRFDGTGDWLLLHFEGVPGELAFDIKGNSFSEGTFTVQTSEDGETYTDFATYTELGATEHEVFNNLGEDVRYIKWIYTEKVNGNVALGNITLGEYTGPVASITVTPATVEVDAEEHEGTLALAYENLEISDMTDFDIQYYDAEGEETETPDWIEVLVAEQDPEIGEGYVVSYYMFENEGEARSAYFKVFAAGDDDFVYSNLITINQEEYVAPIETEDYAVFTGDLIEGDYLIVYNGYAMNNVVTSGRLQYEEVEPENDVISTNNAAIVWHIARNDEGYWTIYSAAANAYAAGTGVKNKAQLLEDGTDAFALWTVEGLETFEFVNKGNSEANVNANLRNNGAYGFACYSTATGGALTLYKKVTTTASYTLNITGYGESDGGYYLIASPVYGLNPANVEGMIEGEYDLYAFDQAQNDQEWRNYKADAFQYLTPGKGYLYAHSTDVELTFTGMPYEGDGKVALDYVEGVNLTGWNLIGNPYNEDYGIMIGNESGYSETNFYVMNANGDDFELAERSVVHPMEGVLVEATAAGQFALFSNETGAWGGDPIKKLNIRVSDENGKGDFARIRFGEGNNLEKFMLNPENTKIYFPVDGEEYAVVYADNMGEMPLNFSAAADGTYTLNINPEDMEMEYLHLIDNMTGMDVDLLANPDYSFEATTNDNAARFTLVFADLTGIEENSDNFAFFSNGNVIVSNEGNAMLQVVDMTGRIVKSENINGTTSVSVEAAPGVYMLRLVNGDNMKVQKIVVR
jgi:hypothetical protein